MRCEEARPLISAELDEELEGNRAAQLRAHLAECVLCSTERETLAATLRVLRDLPEAEPPAELRRRIGMALLEAERASEGHWSGLAWLRRPRAPAWAWGAVLGAAIAAIVVTAPRPQAPSRDLAVAPKPTPAAGSRGPAPLQSAAALHREPTLAAAPKKPAAPGFRRVPPPVTAMLPPMPPAIDSLPSTPPVESSRAGVSPPPRHPRFVPSRPSHRLAVMHGGSPPAPIAKAAPLPANSPADRRIYFGDDSSRLAQSMPPKSTDSTTAPPSDPDASSDTSGMTQMASGGAMPPPQEPADNDLVELRRRLTDRPLQIPELGQLKPANSTLASHDGWIRF